MYKPKYVRGLCDLHGCQEPRVTNGMRCEGHNREWRFHQSFNLGLRSRLLYNLEQARQELAYALEQGLVEDIKRHAWKLEWMSLELEDIGDIVIDGSVSYPALPEKRNSHD